MMQDRTFRGQSADGVWHEGFLIRSPGVKNSRPGEGHIGFYAKIAGKNSRDYNPCCLRALLYIGKVVGNISDTPYLMKEAGEEQKK